MKPGEIVATVRWVIFIILVLILSGCGGGGGGSSSGTTGTGGTISLSWDAPTTNVDGTALNDLAGYKVYYRKASESDYLHDPVIIDDPQKTTCTIILPAGEYYFIVKAYNASGDESDPSDPCPPEGTPVRIPR